MAALMLHVLPTLNACLNTLAAGFLMLGWLAIRSGNRERHKKLMLTALVCSALFLGTYLTYHFMVPGVTRYQGEGVLRILYFSILVTHTPLAIVILPFSLLAVRHGLRGDFQKHVCITRWLLPVWLYVSVTGVLIYLMLYIF